MCHPFPDREWEILVPEFPISLYHTTQLWLLVGHLLTTFPQYTISPTPEAPPDRDRDSARHITNPMQIMGPAELDPLWNRTPTRNVGPIASWTTVEIVNLLTSGAICPGPDRPTGCMDQAVLAILEKDMDGQALTELLYELDKNSIQRHIPTG